MSPKKSCFLVALAATLVLACSMSAFGGKPPVLSYQVIQLDLVDQDSVAYAYSMANNVSSPSQGSRQVVGYVRHGRPSYPRVLDDQGRQRQSPV